MKIERVEYAGGRVVVYRGDVRAVLASLGEGSVQCCVTSPPYWGLRSYLKPDDPLKPLEMGCEPTPDLYVQHLVEVFRGVRRVLRDDGLLFLNLGDSYWGGKGQNGTSKALGNAAERGWVQSGGTPVMAMRPQDGRHDVLKPKDLCMMPARVAMALQADGWWLRSMIPWLKRNPMPESTTDRPSSAVEYVFLLAKSARPFYDGEGVRVRGAGVTGGACFGKQGQDAEGTKAQQRKYDRPDYGTRARRNSDWWMESWQGLYTDDDGEPLALIVNPAAYKEAHFATFPPGLVQPCIKAGTSEKGCCPTCGAPWGRVVERQGSTSKAIGKSAAKRAQGLATAFSGYEDGSSAPTFRTLGWRPTCGCPVAEPVPCTCLDVFCGSGTTLGVAAQLGRHAIGIELNSTYLPMIRERVEGTIEARRIEKGGTPLTGDPAKDAVIEGRRTFF